MQRGSPPTSRPRAEALETPLVRVSPRGLELQQVPRGPVEVPEPAAGRALHAGLRTRASSVGSVAPHGQLQRRQSGGAPRVARPTRASSAGSAARHVHKGHGRTLATGGWQCQELLARGASSPLRIGSARDFWRLRPRRHSGLALPGIIGFTPHFSGSARDYWRGAGPRHWRLAVPGIPGIRRPLARLPTLRRALRSRRARHTPSTRQRA